MDIILLIVCGYYLVKGCVKGLVSTLLSFVGTFVIVVLAWKLSPALAEILKGVSFIENGVTNFVANALNSTFNGTFSNVQEFESKIASVNIIFLLFAKIFLKDITFEQNLTAGQILGASISSFAFKIIAFLLLFIGNYIILMIFRFVVSKIIKIAGLGFGNRVLGGVLGIFKGIIVFSVFYSVVVMLANITLNDMVLKFLQSGNISNFVYTSLVPKIINIFYRA